MPPSLNLKLALGVPIMGSIMPEVYPTHLALAAEMRTYGSLVISTSVDLAPHDKARNKIMDEVFAAGCEYLMFVDADSGVPVGAFRRLLDTLLLTKGKVVTAHCYRRGYPFTTAWSKERRDKKGGYEVTSKGRKPVEIDGCGFPCTLLDLSWIKDNLTQPWFLIESDGGRRTKWEDWHFCERVREMGGKVIGEPRVRCDHYGSMIRINDDNVDQLRAFYFKEYLDNGRK